MPIYLLVLCIAQMCIGYSRHKKKTTFIGGMELVSLRCNRDFTSASSYGLGRYNMRLQLSDTSSIPPMHGGFLLVHHLDHIYIECRCFGLSTFWFWFADFLSVDFLVRRGLSTFCCVEVLVCWLFSLSTLWSVDFVDCQRFGLPTFWLSTFRFIDVVTGYHRHVTNYLQLMT